MKNKVGHMKEVHLKDGTSVYFRRDTGKKAHPIVSKGYKDPVDHYNVEVKRPKAGSSAKGESTIISIL